MKLLIISFIYIIVLVDISLAQNADTLSVEEIRVQPDTLITYLNTVTERMNQISASLSGQEVVEHKVFRYGLGFGWRYAYKTKGELIEASISPVDTSLYIDKGDRVALILSGVLVASPFGNCGAKNSNGFNCPMLSWRRIEFIAALNLIELIGGDLEAMNMRSVEGGFGVGYQLHPKFSLSVTFDRIFNRRIRDNIIKREGEILYDRGQVVYSLDKNDDRFFKEDNLLAFGIRFIYKI